MKDWPKKVAIIGASGFLGSFLFWKLSSCCEVIGTRCSDVQEDLIPLNTTRRDEVQEF